MVANGHVSFLARAIAVFLKSTTTLVNLDLSFNSLENEGAEAGDAGRTDLILMSVWPSAASSDRPLGDSSLAGPSLLCLEP